MLEGVAIPHYNKLILVKKLKSMSIEKYIYLDHLQFRDPLASSLAMRRPGLFSTMWFESGSRSTS